MPCQMPSLYPNRHCATIARAFFIGGRLCCYDSLEEGAVWILILRLWIFWLGLALCGVFAGLAVLGASIPVILCVGFAVLIVSVWLVAWLLSLFEEPLSVLSRQLQEITEELKKR